MKAPTAVAADIRRRLGNTWATDLTGTTVSWPHRFSLGATTKTALENEWQTTYEPLRREWREWVSGRPARLLTAPKRVYSTTQDIPTHVEIDSIEAAASVAGDGWDVKLRRAEERLARLTDAFPATENLATVIRAVHEYSNVDFDLLQTVARWFQVNDAAGLTPRQVPVPGVHAKWLNTHQSLITALSCQESLGLLPPHPARIHFTYLDSEYRKSGRRHHDSATVGDAFAPPYRPEVVVISENKDTALHFPPVEGGIAVEGDGFGGKTAAAFPWLTGASRLCYWGDIDTHGYEILNGWREDGVEVDSILMDLATYETYERFGTDTDQKGVPLKPATPKALPLLAPGERDVYNLLLCPDLRGHRRVEQERLPLSLAADAVAALREVARMRAT
ncbi:Wadjet anti-phage system protein JetD domain-containing protein [Amycolatopsis sp. NPDC003861]